MKLALEYEIATAPNPEAERGGDGYSSAGVSTAPTIDLLLEKNAELLLALEYLAHRSLRLDPRLPRSRPVRLRQLPRYAS